jgi:lipoyl(octanoyl) transferase
LIRPSALGGPQSVAEAQSLLVTELARLIGYQEITNTEEAA